MWVYPFLFGFMQASMVFIIELVNLVNISAQVEIMDTIMNYVALAVVAEFDDVFFTALSRGDKMTE